MKSYKIRAIGLPRLLRGRSPWAGILAGLAVAIIALAVSRVVLGQRTLQNPPLPPIATTMPDVNQMAKMQDQQAKQQNFEAVNAERKRQIAEDSARLLKLAVDLKAEVDKTSKDTLSLNVIRKAEEIEKLARNVKEKMKVTVGPG